MFKSFWLATHMAIDDWKHLLVLQVPNYCREDRKRDDEDDHHSIDATAVSLSVSLFQ